MRPPRRPSCASRRRSREELREHRVDVNAVAPGALNTRMLDEVLAAGPERVGQRYYEQALEPAALRRLAAGARCGTRGMAGVGASDGVTAKLVSAVWDPGSSLPKHLDDLASDIYTLRRIVPRDRGLDWGDD